MEDKNSKKFILKYIIDANKEKLPEAKKRKKNSTNKTIDQHFIPQFYLNLFSNPNRDIYVLNVKYGGITPKKSAQIMYEKILYDIDFFGECFDEFEGYFCKMEDLLSTMLEQLPKSIGDSKAFRLNKFHVMLLSAIQFCRNPYAELSNLIYISTHLHLYYTNLVRFPYKEFLPPFKKKELKWMSKKIAQSLKNEGMCNTFPLIWTVRIFIFPFLIFDYSNIDEVKVLKIKNNGEFISSDNPVVIDSTEKFLNFKSFQFPLGKKLMLYHSNNDTNPKVNDLNMKTYNNAYLKVISSDPQVLDELKLINS